MMGVVRIFFISSVANWYIATRALLAFVLVLEAVLTIELLGKWKIK